MRLLLFALIVFPTFASGQVNRSAKELASETVGDYIHTKLFRNKEYRSISFDDLKPIGTKQSVICWSIAHRFEISESGSNTFDGSARRQVYTFLFFLDEKMKVRKAETSFSRGGEVDEGDSTKRGS